MASDGIFLVIGRLFTEMMTWLATKIRVRVKKTEKCTDTHILVEC